MIQLFFQNVDASSDIRQLRNYLIFFIAFNSFIYNNSLYHYNITSKFHIM
jgi:hypothetical protein